MAWWQGRLVGFDLETTAADPEDARIVSVALVAVGDGAETESWTSLVVPSVEIPDEAIEIHGITNERAHREGIGRTQALETIFHYVSKSIERGWPLVDFNARYDLTVLDREARRSGMNPGLLEYVWVVDPIVIEKHLDRYRPKRVASHSLEDCCRVWKVKLDMAHDAAFDAIAGCRLAYRLAKDGRVIRRTRDDAERREFIELSQEWERVRGDLEALQEFQRRIAWAESERLEEYFRRGDPGKGVPAQPDRVCPREWPVIPFDPAERAVGREVAPASEAVTPEWTI